MATLDVQTVSRSGLNPSFSGAASGGDEFPWSTRAVLYVKNGDSASHTVTVASQISSSPQGLTSDDLSVDVPAGEDRVIGPFSERAWADSDGNVQVSYDDTTSVEVAVIEVP